MAEPPTQAQPQGLSGQLVKWGQRLGEIEGQVRTAEKQVRRDPPGCKSRDEYDELIGEISGLRGRSRLIIEAAGDLRSLVSELRAEWTASRRWTPEGLEEMSAEIASAMEQGATDAAARWLAELLDALDAQEWMAVRAIAGFDLPWPERLRSGAEYIADLLGAWEAGGVLAGLNLMIEVAGGTAIDRWEAVLTPRLQSRAHRLAAWIARGLNGDRNTVLEHLDRAVELFPYGGRMRAERAAYLLSVEEFGRGRTDAQQAIEQAGDTANGFLELGIWAEFSGEFDAADDLYDRGLDRMPSFEITRLTTRARLIDPPGRLLARAAEMLLKRDRYAWALDLADQALLANPRGAEPHPQAAVHALMSRALEEEPGHTKAEAAAAACRAGKLYLWNGAVDDAVEMLEHARDLDENLVEAQWLLADAMVEQSLPLGRTRPNSKAVSLARTTWEKQAKRQLPAGDSAWAYLTRAVIADLETQRPRADREFGIWSAIGFVERTLIHDDTDAQAWGYAAQYLRYAGLEQLALEAAERGSELSPNDRRVLSERLVLLTAHDRHAEAAEVADRVVALYGHDPLVGAVRASLAIRRADWDTALKMLELPLADGNNRLWYLDLRALCYAGMKNPEAAGRDYARMLREEEEGDSPAIDGTDKCRLAMAALSIGMAHLAERWLDAARGDRTTPPTRLLAATAWLRAVEGRLDDAAQCLAEAVQAATRPVQIDEMERALELRGPLVPLVSEHVDALLSGLRAARAKRDAYLVDHPSSADAEMADLMASVEAEEPKEERQVAEAAVWAVASRRYLRAGDRASAADGYRRLLDLLRPEAGIALARILREEIREHARSGDVDGVRDLQAQLVDVEASVSPVELALGLARALRAAGHLDEARATLVAQLAGATDPDDRAAVHRRLGKLALAAEDVDDARQHLRAALDLARAAGHSGTIGRLEVRLAVVALIDGDDSLVARHLDSAFEAWEELGSGRSAATVAGDFVRLADEAAQRDLVSSDAAATIAARWRAERRREDQKSAGRT